MLATVELLFLAFPLENCSYWRIIASFPFIGGLPLSSPSFLISLQVCLLRILLINHLQNYLALALLLRTQSNPPMEADFPDQGAPEDCCQLCICPDGASLSYTFHPISGVVSSSFLSWIHPFRLLGVYTLRLLFLLQCL